MLAPPLHRSSCSLSKCIPCAVHPRDQVPFLAWQSLQQCCSYLQAASHTPGSMAHRQPSEGCTPKHISNSSQPRLRNSLSPYVELNIAKQKRRAWLYQHPPATNRPQQLSQQQQHSICLPQPLSTASSAPQQPDVQAEFSSPYAAMKHFRRVQLSQAQVSSPYAAMKHFQRLQLRNGQAASEDPTPTSKPGYSSLSHRQGMRHHAAQQCQTQGIGNMPGGKLPQSLPLNSSVSRAPHIVQHQGRTQPARGTFMVAAAAATSPDMVNECAAGCDGSLEASATSDTISQDHQDSQACSQADTAAPSQHCLQAGISRSSSWLPGGPHQPDRSNAAMSAPASIGQQHFPVLHVFGINSSNTSSHQSWLDTRHAQGNHPRDVPDKLRRLPQGLSSAIIDITHLMDLQSQTGAEAGYQDPESSSSGSSKRRWKDLSHVEKQLCALESIHGAQQQLLWVTVYQPQGGKTPAAIWVQPWVAHLEPEQLQVVNEPWGRTSVLLQVQDRPLFAQQPTAVVEGLSFEAEPSTGNSTRGNSSQECFVYDTLLLSSGDFSVVEHQNMFPNAVVHCGDGRQLHSARGANDVACFVAKAELWGVEAHCDNLIRMAWDKRHQGTDLSWVYQKLVQRWGDAALLRLGVTPAYVKQGLHRVMLGLGGTQTGAGNLAPTTLGKDAAAAVLARPERSYSLAACTS